MVVRSDRQGAPQSPQPLPDDPGKRNEFSAGLMALLKAEDEAREARSTGELQTLMANEMMRLCGARQAFILRSGVQGQLLAAVSSLSAFDRNAPLVQAIEHVVGEFSKDTGLAKAQEFQIEAYAGTHASTLETYPFRWLSWVPLAAPGGRLLGGVLMARETPWNKAESTVSLRLGRAFAHCWHALELERRPVYSMRLSWRKIGLGCIAIASGLFIPVPMTTLAPVEIGSRDEFVVAAPIDGVIDTIEIEPNAVVSIGDPIVRLADTVNRNKLEVAEREVAVASARLTKTEQLAFSDVRGRHDVGISRAELSLRTAERDYARDLLAKTDIRATRNGVAVYTDKRDLIGKPVATGERILVIADSREVEVRIDVLASDAFILRQGARVKVFFDTDPLNSREAVVRRADYMARVRPGGILAYRVVADLTGREPPPRLGSRGTAQLYGDRVPLAFYLFRRPLTALRQRTGL